MEVHGENAAPGKSARMSVRTPRWAKSFGWKFPKPSGVSEESLSYIIRVYGYDMYLYTVHISINVLFNVQKNDVQKNVCIYNLCIYMQTDYMIFCTMYLPELCISRCMHDRSSVPSVELDQT